MKKRIAALLLTLAMVVTYMPTMAVTSFADGGFTKCPLLTKQK